MHVVVYTANIGNYDKVRTDKATGYRCVYISDTKIDVPGWELWLVDRRFPDDPNRESDLYKWLPHHWFPGADYSIWLDSNIVLRAPPNTLLNYLNTGEGFHIALHAHLCRTCLYDEARIVRGDKRITKTSLQQRIIDLQVREYQERGYPAGNGLAETNVLVRRNLPDINHLNEGVFIELSRYSQRDQLCFNYVAWQHNIRYATLPGNARTSPFFDYQPHAR